MSVMSGLDLELCMRPRCANCGQSEEISGIPVTTIISDIRTELICDRCVARFDWSDWNFDPVLNVYWRKLQSRQHVKAPS